MNQIATASKPPRIGQPWPEQGGLYTGIMRGENGQPDYHLITPTAPEASIKNIIWAESYANQVGAQSHVDGLANTRFLCASAISHPAAQWTAGLIIDGHADFYLPARHEARLMYINLPDQFETDDWYWTSTQLAAVPDYAWVQSFFSGNQTNLLKSGEYRARAVRRILIIE
jgi:hypothetical protein